jgi:hypothetical protein
MAAFLATHHRTYALQLLDALSRHATIDELSRSSVMTKVVTTVPVPEHVIREAQAKREPSARKRQDTVSMAMLSRGFLVRGDRVRMGKHTGTIVDLKTVFVNVQWDAECVADARSRGRVILAWPRAKLLTKLAPLSST